MVKSPRGRDGPAPVGRGTGGITIGPLPTTLALAGSGIALDCALAAPGREGAALWASATAQLPTSNAPASFSNTFFIDNLAFRFSFRLRHQEWFEIAVQRQPDLGLVRLSDLASAAAPAAGGLTRNRRIGTHDCVVREHAA